MNMALFPDVVVNGETIPSAAIAAEAQNHTAPKDKPGIAWRKAAQALAIRALLLQEARARGLTADPEELSPGRVETEDEALIRALLDEALTIAPVTDAEVQRRMGARTRTGSGPPPFGMCRTSCAPAIRVTKRKPQWPKPAPRPSWRGWTATQRALPWPPAKAIADPRRKAAIWASLAPAIPCPSSKRRCAACPKAA